MQCVRGNHAFLIVPARLYVPNECYESKMRLITLHLRVNYVFVPILPHHFLRAFSPSKCPIF
ncbi:hypothetical protein DsansV1_C26g0194741 [Dioscorea sansibarensis]